MPDTPVYRCHDARKTQRTLDLLNRLTRAALLYMHDADPKNGTPRTIVFQTKNVLLNLCEEANTLLCASAPLREPSVSVPRASASPRETQPTTEGAPK